MRKEIKKTAGERGMYALKHGNESLTIKNLQEQLKSMPMKDVDKMKFNHYLDMLKVRNFAFEIDQHIKSHLVDAIQSTDKKLVSYLADLANTQMKLSDLQHKVQFHEKVLSDLQEQYISSLDESEKSKIYEKIQEVEKSIGMFERNVKDYLELRNKIRKEIDKSKYMEKSHELKKQELKDSGASAKVVDLSVMDNIV